MPDLAAPLNTLLIALLGITLTSLLGLLAWVGRQALLKLDRLVEQLAELNRRIGLLEARMSRYEGPR